MTRAAVLNVVGLTRGLIGDDTQRLREWVTISFLWCPNLSDEGDNHRIELGWRAWRRRS